MKKVGGPRKINWLHFYVHRYWRFGRFSRSVSTTKSYRRLAQSHLLPPRDVKLKSSRLRCVKCVKVWHFCINRPHSILMIFFSVIQNHLWIISPMGLFPGCIRSILNSPLYQSKAMNHCIFPLGTILISAAVCYEISRPVIYISFTK